MFGHLLAFLRNFPHLPVLLMTASLPEERRRAIERIRSDLSVIPGPKEFELLERYLVQESAADEDVWLTIEKCIREGGKVLWVRNRVAWANDAYEECRRRFTHIAVDIYHSRFRYKDRSTRHRRVIDRFRRECTATILVATQVAEMSLDLSADLLITDIAPIPSLIQRLGRLNRRSTPDKPLPPKLAIVRALPRGEPNATLPYESEDIENASRWLSSLVKRGKALSQHDLSKAFSEFNDAAEYDLTRVEERAIFFSGLWRTRPGLTRSEGYTMSVILEKDLKHCNERDRQGEPTRDWLRKYEVSIPIKQAAMRWERVGVLRIAPSDMIEYDYDEKTGEGTGAKWREK
jgi:CRISPR-associated endonuclease/helicase Cas3